MEDSRDVGVNEEPQEIVHKLQRAVQYASRQKQLQEEEAAATSIREHESHTAVIDAREQRSHIAIIQMAPPASNSIIRNKMVSATATLNDSSTSPAAGPDVCHSSSSSLQQGHQQTTASNKSGASVRKQENASSKKKRHYCSVHGCTYNTPHSKDLARHMRKHTGEKPYNCDRCSKSFTRYDKLVLHIRTHEGFRPFACRICNHTATDSSSLKKHLRTHTDDRPYKCVSNVMTCQICSYASKDSSQLVVHLRRHTGDCPYTCTFNQCDAAFKTPSDLSRHTRLHTGEKPYKCSYCDYRAAVKCNLNAHMKRHTNPVRSKGNKTKTVPRVRLEDEDCSKDDETFSSLSANALPFQYACKLCEFKADSIDQFCVHMQEIHPDSKQGTHSINSKTGKAGSFLKNKSLMKEKKFQCNSCRAAFVCEESLRCHLRQHTTIPNKPANVAPELYTPNRVRVVQQSNNLSVQNNFSPAEESNTSTYILHEMQRVPIVHSVITENPAVTGNTISTSQSQQHQLHFSDESSTSSHQNHQHNMYVVTYNTTENVAYRPHVEYVHETTETNE